MSSDVSTQGTAWSCKSGFTGWQVSGMLHWHKRVLVLLFVALNSFAVTVIIVVAVELLCCHCCCCCRCYCQHRFTIRVNIFVAQIPPPSLLVHQNDSFMNSVSSYQPHQDSEVSGGTLEYARIAQWGKRSTAKIQKCACPVADGYWLVYQNYHISDLDWTSIWTACFACRFECPDYKSIRGCSNFRIPTL